MRTEKRTVQDHVLQVEILLEKEEFDQARKKAYLDNTDRYPVPGVAPGLAELSDLEKIYGPAVLFDEALSLAVPDSFLRALQESGLRIVGKPVMEGLQFLPGGGVSFTVKADLFPKVELGQYKGIAVPYLRSGQQAEFERAVVQKACENMKGEIPPHMIRQKLDAMEAQVKLQVNGDAVYHLLADMLVILDQAYVAAGVNRPAIQVKREAMDLMLQTASAEHELDWKEFFKEQVTVMAERYHSLPGDYPEKLDRIIRKRSDDKAKMSPDQRTAELFKAYLGSLELTQEQWRNQQSAQAAREVCMDLLLDAVAEAEAIDVEPGELRQFIEELAAGHQMEPEEVEANIDRDALAGKLRRDKALALILNSATTDYEGKARLDRQRAKAQETLNDRVEIKERQ